MKEKLLYEIVKKALKKEDKTTKSINYFIPFEMFKEIK